MTSDVIQIATDVATYVGAVSAGVSANALTESARALVNRVMPRLRNKPAEGLLVVTPELVREVAELLAADKQLMDAAQACMSSVTIDRSIVITAHRVSDVRMDNR